MVPDKESDIKPRFHKSKSHTQKHTDGGDPVWIISLYISYWSIIWAFLIFICFVTRLTLDVLTRQFLKMLKYCVEYYIWQIKIKKAHIMDQ